MGFVVWLVILAVLIACGWSTALWVYVVLSALLLMAAVAGGPRKAKSGRPAGTGKAVTRIDRPHYISDDEYECSVCGTRFKRASMTCPRCGVRFNRTETKEDEYDDELEEELEMDEWDEEEG